jgi:hypothetical protein
MFDWSLLRGNESMERNSAGLISIASGIAAVQALQDSAVSYYFHISSWVSALLLDDARAVLF